MYQPILAVESSAYLMPVAPVLGNNVLLSGSIGRSFSALGCSLQSRWNLERAVDEEAFFQQAESLLFFCVGDQRRRCLQGVFYCPIVQDVLTVDGLQTAPYFEIALHRYCTCSLSPQRASHELYSHVLKVGFCTHFLGTNQLKQVRLVPRKNINAPILLTLMRRRYLPIQSHPRPPTSP